MPIRPRVTLAPTNIFDMFERCLAAATRAHMPPEEIDRFRRQVFTSGGYCEALHVIDEFFEVSAL